MVGEGVFGSGEGDLDGINSSATDLGDIILGEEAGAAARAAPVLKPATEFPIVVINVHPDTSHQFDTDWLKQELGFGDETTSDEFDIKDFPIKTVKGFFERIRHAFSGDDPIAVCQEFRQQFEEKIAPQIRQWRKDRDDNNYKPRVAVVLDFNVLAGFTWYADKNDHESKSYVLKLYRDITTIYRFLYEFSRTENFCLVPIIIFAQSIHVATITQHPLSKRLSDNSRILKAMSAGRQRSVAAEADRGAITCDPIDVFTQTAPLVTGPFVPCIVASLASKKTADKDESEALTANEKYNTNLAAEVQDSGVLPEQKVGDYERSAQNQMRRRKATVMDIQTTGPQTDLVKHLREAFQNPLSVCDEKLRGYNTIMDNPENPRILHVQYLLTAFSRSRLWDYVPGFSKHDVTLLDEKDPKGEQPVLASRFLSDKRFNQKVTERNSAPISVFHFWRQRDLAVFLTAFALLLSMIQSSMNWADQKNNEESDYTLTSVAFFILTKSLSAPPHNLATFIRFRRYVWDLLKFAWHRDVSQLEQPGWLLPLSVMVPLFLMFWFFAFRSTLKTLACIHGVKEAQSSDLEEASGKLYHFIIAGSGLSIGVITVSLFTKAFSDLVEVLLHTLNARRDQRLRPLDKDADSANIRAWKEQAGKARREDMQDFYRIYRQECGFMRGTRLRAIAARSSFFVCHAGAGIDASYSLSQGGDEFNLVNTPVVSDVMVALFLFVQLGSWVYLQPRVGLHQREVAFILANYAACLAGIEEKIEAYKELYYADEPDMSYENFLSRLPQAQRSEIALLNIAYYLVSGKELRALDVFHHPDRVNDASKWFVLLTTNDIYRNGVAFRQANPEYVNPLRKIYFRVIGRSDTTGKVKPVVDGVEMADMASPRSPAKMPERPAVRAVSPTAKDVKRVEICDDKGNPLATAEVTMILGDAIRTGEFVVDGGQHDSLDQEGGSLAVPGSAVV